MNRRSFITKALAGIAAVPLLGKLAQAVTPRTYGDTILSDKPVCYFPFNDPPPRLPAYRTVTLTFKREEFEQTFVLDIYRAPTRDTYFVLKEDHGKHTLLLHSWAVYDDQIRVTAAVIECHEADACKLLCEAPTKIVSSASS